MSNGYVSADVALNFWPILCALLVNLRHLGCFMSNLPHNGLNSAEYYIRFDCLKETSDPGKC